MQELSKEVLQQLILNETKSGRIRMALTDEGSLKLNAILDLLCSEQFQVKRIGVNEETLAATLSILLDEGEDIDVADPYYTKMQKYNFNYNFIEVEQGYKLIIEER